MKEEQQAEDAEGLYSQMPVCELQFENDPKLLWRRAI
jgi:hypothetical protein